MLLALIFIILLYIVFMMNFLYYDLEINKFLSSTFLVNN